MAITPDPRLDRLLRKLEPGVQRAFEEAIRKARASVDLAALVDALERGDIDRALDILRIKDQVLYPLSEAVRSAFIAGGMMAGEALPLVLRAEFGFGTNPRAEAQVGRFTGDLVEGIQQDTQTMLRRVIAAGVNEGIPNAKLARQITGEGLQRTGGFLGLTSGQADSVIRGRSLLASGDPRQMREYLQLELRDKRFDRTIAKAIREGRKLSAAKLDTIIQRHKHKALGYRGRVIARTETLNALRAGQHAGFEQLVETLGERSVEVTWKTTIDGRERDAHRLLNGEAHRLGADFISPATGAAMAYPGDTSQGARGVDVILCRCAAIYRIKRRRAA